MFPMVYSADRGEFVHFDADKQPHDKYVKRIFVQITPMLQRAYVRYIVGERITIEEGATERNLGVMGVPLTYPHVRALVKIGEQFEFFNDKTTSLPTILANDYIGDAGVNVDFPDELDALDFNIEELTIAKTVPAQRITPSSLYLILAVKEGPQGLGYYPESIVGTFQGNGKCAYDLSWDFFFEIVNNPKSQLIAGVDYVFDEELKRLESKATYYASVEALQEESPVVEPTITLELVDAPVESDEAVVVASTDEDTAD